jgi:hypothetical protein
LSAVVIGLLFLACGWKLYKDSIYTRYLALRNTGHPQYFGGALCAILVFTLSFSIDASLSALPLYSQATAAALRDVPVFGDTKERDALLRFARVFILSLPVTWLLIRILNMPFHRSPSLLMAAARKTRIIDELEETIYYCLRAKPQLSLALTTKSGKVYVGVPKRHSPDPDRDRVWISIWPLASGYRDDKGALHLTTFYGDVRGGAASRRLSDYQVVLPIAEIHVAQAFDLLAYAEYKQKKFEDANNENRSLGTLRLNGKRVVIARPLVPDRIEEIPTLESDQHSRLFKIVEHLLPPRDRYLLRMYAYFVAVLVAAFLLLPYGPISLWFLLVAIVACTESIEPISVRIENAIHIWRVRRRRTEKEPVS